MEETEVEDNEYLIIRGVLFDKFRNDEQFTNVVIVTNDGTKFPCHKIILMAGCPFFRGLFRSEMIETRQDEFNLKRIDISGYHFKQILEFIYTGKIKLNYEDAKVLNIYSGLFGMKNLKKLTDICLIKCIGDQTCLELLRQSEKYLNDNLMEACLLFASTETFLDTHLNDVTVEEIKSIASFEKRNCTSRTLLENIVKWIKLNENREQYINDLMILINFDDIADEIFKKQIFSDKTLNKNKEFSKWAINCLLTISKLKTESTQTEPANVPKKTLFVVSNESIFYTDFSRKSFIPTVLYPTTKWFGVTKHITNGFILTGGMQDNTSVSCCTQFCPSTSEKRKFPALLSGRMDAKNYTLGSKIYTCGGYGKKTIETFQENSEKWIYGPSMNNTRYYFGTADDNENSLYAIGGREALNILSTSIDHLDTRTKSWNIIYTDPTISHFTQSVFKDKQIYCFGIDEGYILDLRTNKKHSPIRYIMNNMHFSFYESYDCTIVDDDIWVLGELNIPKCEKSINAIKLNLEKNCWELKISAELHNKIENVGLVWCS